MAEHPFYLVDAFTGEPFQGNRAGVVLDAAGLSEICMQLIAREVGASETTFVLPPTGLGADVRFRWFTPVAEVAMCGHATIAGVHVLVTSGRFTRLLDGAAGELRVATAGGVLVARCRRIAPGSDAFWVWLDLVPPRLSPKPQDGAHWARLLGCPPGSLDRDVLFTQSQDGDLLVFVRDHGVLERARPDMTALAAHCREQDIRGVCVATLRAKDPAFAVQSRFFAPALGVPEDPVTGSVHGPLGAYLVSRGLVRCERGSAEFSCLQGIPGGPSGSVRVAVTRSADGGHCVCVGGQAVTTISGILKVP